MKLLINEIEEGAYQNYPSTKVDELENKPELESRVLPIAYEIPKGSKVLDIGCNDGGFMKILKEKRGCDVTGIDISEKCVEEAKAKGLNVILADAEKLPFEDNSFDVVTCMEVLSHLPDSNIALSEIKRVLKKKGFILGSVPHKLLEIFGWHDRRLHRVYFEEDSLREKLKIEFDFVWIRTLKGAQFSIQLASSYLMDQPCEMLFKCGNSDTKNWDEALQDRGILRCWFGFTQTPGTVYYRMSGYADKMQKMGSEVHYDPYNEIDRDGPSSWIRKIHWNQSEKRFTNQHIVDTLFTLMKAADLSVFQVTSSVDLLLYLTAFRDKKNLYPYHIKKPLILEMDDWFFDLPPYNLASGAYKPNSQPESVTYEQLKLSDYVICSTQYLSDKLKQLMPKKPSYVIPNSVDFDVWDKVLRKTEDHDKNPNLIRIVYTGSGNHSGDLEIVKEPLLALLEEFKDLEFIYVQQREDCFENIGHERIKRFVGWVPLSKFPELLGSWEPDIGIAPLLDNEFNRVKSNLRWLEYSALKVPTIASKVYPFEKSIKDGKDGIVLSNSKKEWYDALKALIVDRGRRATIGETAYKRIKRDFNMDKIARQYKSVLESIKREFNKSSSRVLSVTR